MRVFITGGTGFIGSAVVTRLVAAGHEVVGLARSENSTQRLSALGASAHQGSLDDPGSLTSAARGADGVIHLAFVHDFDRYAESGAIEAAAVTALAEGLEGTGKPLVITSGTAVLAPGALGTETDAGLADGPGAPRVAGENVALAFADRGVRTSIVRLPPSVHTQERQGFAGVLAGIAREKGISGYIGEGMNRWPAVHRDDAADLFVAALETAPAGTVLHAVGEEGIPVIDIARAVAGKVGVPLQQVAQADAVDHFGWIGMAVASDIPASGARTRNTFAWNPNRPGLLADIAAS